MGLNTKGIVSKRAWRASGVERWLQPCWSRLIFGPKPDPEWTKIDQIFRDATILRPCMISRNGGRKGVRGKNGPRKRPFWSRILSPIFMTQNGPNIATKYSEMPQYCDLVDIARNRGRKRVKADLENDLLGREFDSFLAPIFMTQNGPQIFRGATILRPYCAK